MANVWRKRTVRYLDGGKRVGPQTPGAERRVELSRRYYGTLRGSDGRSRQVPLCEDRDASESLLRSLQTQADRDRALGIGPKDKERLRPLAEHVAEYAEHLRAKADTESHVSLSLTRLTAVFTAVKAKTVADLDAGKIARQLAVWREKGTPLTRPGRKPVPLSVGTSNHYTRACRSFSRWLWTEGRTSEDVLRSLKILNGRADRRRVRRALDTAATTRLIEATRDSGRTIRGKAWRMTPDDRAWLYTLASYTGLRASELASLSKASVNLTAGTVTVQAAYSKRRRNDVLPLHVSLISPLHAWLSGKPDGPLWPGPWARHGMSASILRRDLRQAGIAYRDEQGRYVDFHALRHTFVSSLARSGVLPGTAKSLARHSTITLTMDVYSHVETEELRRSLDTLPALPGTRPPEPPSGTLPRVA